MNEVSLIGGGPAGLMAAEVLLDAGRQVTLYELMPTPGRKFLLAGRGGLNLTHSEPLGLFLTRYGDAETAMETLIKAFPPDALRAWSASLGQETFIGTSGRVFPRAFKTSPLLRAWLRRLAEKGLVLKAGHRWTGWDDAGALQFETPQGRVAIPSDVTLLALGGASWPKLGSDGSWVPLLESRGVTISPLRPANCGFIVDWSKHLIQRFAGSPLKRIALTFGHRTVRGEGVVSATGIEGGAVYALSSEIREAVLKDGHATLLLDLRPDLDTQLIESKLSVPKGSVSLANHLRKRLALPPVAIALLYEVDRNVGALSPAAMARLIKAVPVTVTGVQPLERAISSAGGVSFAMLDEQLMLKALPGVFCAGEMLDWEAPTGGYLLQGVMASGHMAAQGILAYSGQERA